MKLNRWAWGLGVLGAGISGACSFADSEDALSGGNYAPNTPGISARAPEEEADVAEVGGAGGQLNQPEPFYAANPYVVAAHDPLSTFAADVDTASYSYFRSSVRDYGTEPEAATVRLEEFVNFFEYDYPKPKYGAEAEPFLIHLDGSPNLANRGTRLLRVGIQGMEVPLSERKQANLVFLVDASGSMQEEMAMVQAVLRQTKALLSTQDTISIVQYAASAGVLLPATPVSESKTIDDAIDQLRSGGSTNGAGGLNAAYAQAESVFVEGGINHVLLCTDGDFNVGLRSDEDLVEVIEEKRISGVTLTALGFGYGYNDSLMEAVSNAGNGIYGYIGSEADATEYVNERMLQTLMHIAKDVKLQVEFNPAYVQAYRLLGYENRDIQDEDFRNDVIDAGEVGSGHSVTALYELVLQGDPMPSDQDGPALDDGAAFAGDPEVDDSDLVLVKLRYKAPGAQEEDAAKEISASLSPEKLAAGFEGAHSDLQWAAAVAAYAEILKKSPYASSGSMDAIRAVVKAQAGSNARRSEFNELMIAAGR